MMKGEFMNSKERKQFLKLLEELYGIEKESVDDSFSFFVTEKKRVYVVNKESANYFLELNLKPVTFGTYIGTFEKDGVFRLSIEGSQFFGKYAKKCILNLNSCLAQAWLLGEKISLKELNKEDLEKIEGCKVVVLKYKEDFIGSGKISNNYIVNFVPKERRVKDIKY